MGQSFILFNVDKKQEIALWAKYGECWGSQIMSQIVPMLAPTIVNLPEDPLAGLGPDPRTLFKDKTLPEKTGLHSLAPEIHGMIFRYLSHYYDAYAYCLVNTYFWIVGMPRLRVLYVNEAKKRQNMWDGDRIICLGEYAEDLPEGMLTEAETAALMAQPSDPEEGRELYQKFFQWTEPVPGSERLSRRYHKKMEAFVNDELGNSSWRFRRRHHHAHDWRGPYNARLIWEFRDGFPYILRNLTKKVYIRADELALRPEDVHGV